MKKIDKGFSLNYFKLSYRRRFIRAIWVYPLTIVAMFFVMPEGVARSLWIGLVCIISAADVIFNYKKWKNALENNESPGETENSLERPRKKTMQKLLTGLLIGILAIAVIALIGFIGSRFMLKRVFTTPDELKDVSVLVENKQLKKKLLYHDERLGFITDIVVNTHGAYKDFSLGVAGSKSAVFSNARADFSHFVPYSEPADVMNIVDVDGDGRYEFLNRQGTFEDRKSALHESGGNLVWSYNAKPEGHGVNTSAVGDVDGDGIMEFVVGFNGATGVHLLNRYGGKIWSFPDSNVWHVEMADIDNDGKEEIIHTRTDGVIVVRDGQGKIISQAKPDMRITDFSLCTYPAESGTKCIISAQDNSIILLLADGTIVANFDVPRCKRSGHARGTLVQFRVDEPAYFAVVVEYKHWYRSLLCIYNADRELVYQEIIGNRCQAIAVLPCSDGLSGETLLVGSEDRLWEYSMDR